MKFAETLASQITPEWRTQYLRYDEMKAMLYDALESSPVFDAEVVASGADADDRELYQSHIQQFQDQFFSFADRELTKVNTFFSEKLSEALRKFSWLKSSVKYFQFKQQEISATALNKATRTLTSTTTTATLGHNLPMRNHNDVETGTDAHATADGIIAARRASITTTRNAAAAALELHRESDAFAAHMSSVRRRGKFARLIPMSEEDRKQSKRYRKINDLKLAFSEFYLSLILLQNYQNLNYTACRKIMKKHDKLFKTSLGGEWKQKNVDIAPFFTSKEIDRLIVEVENMVTIDLEGGDRQRAMKRLRVPPLAERTTTWDFFRNGFALGSFAVLLACVIICTIAQGLPENTTWDVVIRMYRGHFFLVIFVFLCGFNVNGWANAGVNHVLIFELNPRNHLSHHNLLEIAGVLANLWCITFLGFLFSKHISIPQYAWPLILLGIHVAIFFCPFKVFYYPARKWLLYELFRCIAAPFFVVTFADFWLADQLNSLVVVLRDLQFLVCFYAVEVRWWTHPASAGTCNSNLKTFGIRPLVVAFPAWIRFAQCLRRYHDTRLAFPHLMNAAKYATSFLVVLFSTLDSIDKESDNSRAPSERVWFYAWILSAVVSSCFGYGWDVKMDWGFFDRRAARTAPLLREDMVYSTRWLYYFAIVEDFVLRFAWVISISVGEITAGFQEYLLIILGVLELVRRFIWNYFRLENEHLNNCGQFRAVRDISIAPVKRDDLQKIEDMMDNEDGMYHGRYSNIDDDDEGSDGRKHGGGGRSGAILVSKHRRHTLHAFVSDDTVSSSYRKKKKKANKRNKYGNKNIQAASKNSRPPNNSRKVRRINEHGGTASTDNAEEEEADEFDTKRYPSAEAESLLSQASPPESAIVIRPDGSDSPTTRAKINFVVTSRRTSDGNKSIGSSAVASREEDARSDLLLKQNATLLAHPQPNGGSLLEMRRLNSSTIPAPQQRPANQHAPPKQVHRRSSNTSAVSGSTVMSARRAALHAAAEMRANADDATRDGIISNKRRPDFNQSRVSSSSSTTSSDENNVLNVSTRSSSADIKDDFFVPSSSAVGSSKPLSVVGARTEAQQREQPDAAAAAGAADAVEIAAAGMHAADAADDRRQQQQDDEDYDDLVLSLEGVSSPLLTSKSDDVVTSRLPASMTCAPDRSSYEA